jgi:uncharacterized protein YbgA (DUF1722 family)/uncharacterized protein YbbK (DUF523 family)
MVEWAKPVIVVSRCLEYEPVRYNAQVIPYDFVRQLEPWVTFVPVCPELEIGLGVPRDPVRIVSIDGEARLIQPTTDRDVTREMNEFSESFLSSLHEVDGFLLKNRSPSCGISDVKIYQRLSESGSSGRGAGIFAGHVLERFPGLAIEDEGRLRNYRIREHFLTRLFSLAALRRVKANGSMKDLVRFHSENKFILMGYSQKELRLLGRIVANPDKRPFAEVIDDYVPHFQAALAKPPRYTSMINVFQHAAGYFSKQLKRGEKQLLQSSTEKYRAKQVPAAAVTAILRAWIARFDEEYLGSQTFFDPYPSELMSVSDSGKGRDL